VSPLVQLVDVRKVCDPSAPAGDGAARPVSRQGRMIVPVTQDPRLGKRFARRVVSPVDGAIAGDRAVVGDATALVAGR
jgi:hypothetical protein